MTSPPRESRRRSRSDGIEIRNLLFRDDIVHFGPLMEELAFLVHARLSLSECGAKLGASKVGLQSSAVRQTKQVHLPNRLQGIRLVGVRHKSRNTVGFHAFRRRIEADPANGPKFAKPFMALQQLGIAQRHR